MQYEADTSLLRARTSLLRGSYNLWESGVPETELFEHVLSKHEQFRLRNTSFSSEIDRVWETLSISEEFASRTRIPAGTDLQGFWYRMYKARTSLVWPQGTRSGTLGTRPGTLVHSMKFKYVHGGSKTCGVQPTSRSHLCEQAVG